MLSGGRTICYEYDAWGVCTVVQDDSACGIANINPYRYRGYYYDQENGMYYLQSRYYDPVVGRFVNADVSEYLGAERTVLTNTLYAYCKNNAVNIVDEYGYGALESLVSALGTAADIINNILNLISNSYYKDRKKLQNSVKILTKKQRKYLANINTLNKQIKEICRYLKWFGYALTFITVVSMLAKVINSGASVDRTLLDFVVEAMVNFIVKGAGDLFNKVARYIPYVGFLISVIGGWLLSYYLGKLFNSAKMKRVKNKFASLIKKARISVVNWLRAGMKSLAA